MIYILYNIFVIIISWLIIPISWFNKKINFFVNGRKKTFEKLSSIKKTDKVIWFHCASLGEFEQGRPILENIKKQISKKSKENYKIVLTFFSPSGYEVRKNYEFADVICYLPLDTNKNARRFLDLTHPEMAIFIKYEFWPTILKELDNRKIKTILVSGIFREKQAFFNNGLLSSFMKNSLKTFDHFFVQDKNSKNLLNSIYLDNVTVSGDTRFDRVYEITKQDNSLNFITDFVQNKHILVAGSTWKKDEEILINYINNHATANEKFIIAPHNITAINWLKNSFNKEVTLFSDKIKNNNAQVFIIDTVGILTKIYSYAHVAYVGGGFGTGIHNILEPATFGLPIIIGPKYQKFNEANALIKNQGCFVVENQTDFNAIVKKLNTNSDYRNQASKTSKEYIVNNLGATKSIINYIKSTLPNINFY